MKEYQADELQYKGPVLAQTLVVTVLELPEQNQANAKEYKSPMHISVANKDVLIS